jgi:predicted 3-demethylubiquinone-9 3-methyltransferase (glyoxalase superfamily)
MELHGGRAKSDCHLLNILPKISILFDEEASMTVQAENTDDIYAYKVMATDIEHEWEACEWCNTYFGPVVSNPVHPS